MKENEIKVNDREIEQIKNKVKKAENKKKIIRSVGLFFLLAGAYFYSRTILSPVLYILGAFSFAVGFGLIIKTYIRKKHMPIKYKKHKSVFIAEREPWNPVEQISECRRLCSAISHEALSEEKEKFFSGDKEFFGSCYNEWGIIWLFDETFYDVNKKVFFSVLTDDEYYWAEEHCNEYYTVETKEKVLQMAARALHIIRRIYQTNECDVHFAAVFSLVDSLEVDPDITEYKPPVKVLKGVAYHYS